MIIGGLGVGGAEKHLLSILPRLVQKGYHVRLLMLGYARDLEPFFEEKGIKVCTPKPLVWVKPLPHFLRRFFYLMYSTLRLYRDFKKDRVSVTHFFLPQAYILGGLIALFSRVKAPLLMSRRSMNHYQKKIKGAALLERFLHKRMNLILANSQAVMDQLHLEEKVPKSQLQLIYNGIDLMPFENPSTHTRKDFNLTEDCFVMVCVANIIPYKGHKDLIDALAHVKNDLPKDWRLLCIGRDDGHMDALKAHASSLEIDGYIHFLGARSDVPDILKLADVSILPSHEEGFSNAILESMGASLPVIATDVGGNSEAVLDNTTGWIVPAKDPKVLGKTIVQASKDRNTLKEKGRLGQERAFKLFNAAKCADAYDRVYSYFWDKRGK